MIIIGLKDYNFIQITEGFDGVSITYDDCEIEMSPEQFEELYKNMKEWHEGIANEKKNNL